MEHKQFLISARELQAQNAGRGGTSFPAVVQ
jgi:hypothetical protein